MAAKIEPYSEDYYILLEQLKRFAVIEGTEIGEACMNLVELGHGPMAYLSDEFQNALIKEITEQLDNFVKNSKITRRTVKTETVIEELEWIV